MTKKQLRQRKVLVGEAILLMFVIVGVFLAEMRKTAPDLPSLIQNILLSIVCSIAASFIFALFLPDEGNECQEFREKLRRLEELSKEQDTKLDTIQERLAEESAFAADGIISIRKKAYYDRKNEFWNQMVNTTENHLDLIGHSISSWFKEEYRRAFEDCVLRMLEKGKKVRIILTGPEYDAQKIRNAACDDSGYLALTKPEKTYCNLFKLAEKCVGEECRGLLVYIFPPEKATYLYIRTDKKCYVSPYIVSEQYAKQSFLLEMDIDSEYARAFVNTFDDMIGNVLPISWKD